MNLHDFILEFGEEQVDNLVLFDGQRMQVDFLQVRIRCNPVSTSIDLIFPARTRRPSLVTGTHSFSSSLRGPRRPRPRPPRPLSPPRPLPPNPPRVGAAAAAAGAASAMIVVRSCRWNLAGGDLSILAVTALEEVRVQSPNPRWPNEFRHQQRRSSCLPHLPPSLQRRKRM
jgi:hypothetical protein